MRRPMWSRCRCGRVNRLAFLEAHLTSRNDDDSATTPTPTESPAFFLRSLSRVSGGPVSQLAVGVVTPTVDSPSGQKRASVSPSGGDGRRSS